jgi:hypothetical protein
MREGVLMKTRLGFVSNSSSASFVVSVVTSLDKEEFCNKLMRIGTYGALDVRDFVSELKCSIDDVEKQIEEDAAEITGDPDGKLNGLRESWIEQNKKRLVSRREFLESVNLDDTDVGAYDLSIFDYMLLYNGVVCTEENGVIQFVCGTTMLNSLSDAPQMLKELITMMSFEKEELFIRDMRFKVIHDDYSGIYLGDEL